MLKRKVAKSLTNRSDSTKALNRFPFTYSTALSGGVIQQGDLLSVFEFESSGLEGSN